MQFRDYSPPTTPSSQHQEQALRQGLGRAWQWAAQGRLSSQLLLDACLHDLRFDMQCEEYRGEWLWSTIEAAGASQSLREPLYAALLKFSGHYGHGQLCELAAHYAERGDHKFRDRLCEIVETKPIADMPWLGEDQLLRLDGLRGFMCAARVRGSQLVDRAWDWDDGRLVDEAIELLGEEQFHQVWDLATDADLCRFREAWRVNRRAPSDSPAESMRQISLEDIIAAAETEGASGRFRGWGMHASEGDLEAIRRRLLESQDVSAVAKYLMVFSNRAFSPLIPVAISLCRHSDETVRRRAFAALAKNSEPEVRAFALAELENKSCEGRAVELFVNNFEPGDEVRILECIEPPEDQNALHWLFMDVRKVLKENPQADPTQLGVVAYALTPCSMCRGGAAQLLQERACAPDWLQEECRHDCDEETRLLSWEG